MEIISYLMNNLEFNICKNLLFLVASSRSVISGSFFGVGHTTVVDNRFELF